MSEKEIIKNVSEDACHSFFKKESADLSDCIAEELKKYKDTIKKSSLEHICHTANQMVNLVIRKKISADSMSKFQDYKFELSTSDKVIAKLHGGNRKSSMVSVPVDSTADAEIKVVSPFKDDSDIEAKLKEDAGEIKGKSEEVEPDPNAVYLMGDDAEVFAKLMFGIGTEATFKRYLELMSTVFKKESAEDGAEKDVLVKTQFEINRDEIDRLYNYMRIKFENNPRFEKLSVDAGDMLAISNRNPLVNSTIGKGTEGFFGGFGKGMGQYGGEAAGYATWKNVFDVWTRTKARDVAAKALVDKGVGTLASSGGDYAISLLDKLIAKIRGKWDLSSSMDDRQAMIGDILREEASLVNMATADQILEWYKTLMKIAPQLSKDKGYTKSFLLSAAGVGQVTPDLIEKAGKAEKLFADNNTYGAGDVQIEI